MPSRGALWRLLSKCLSCLNDVQWIAWIRGGSRQYSAGRVEGLNYDDWL